MTRRKRKILVVRVGRAGDLVMITPAINALLAGLPEGELHLLTSAEGARVMRDFHPRLTRMWIYTRRFPRSLLLKPALTRAFVRENYDRIIVLETKAAYRKWLRAVGAPLDVLEPATGDRHFCDRCLDLVAEAVTQPMPRGWVHLPVTSAGREKARALLRENGLGEDDLLVGLHPTFSGSGLPIFRHSRDRGHRNWPEGHFARLARMLCDEGRERGRPLKVVVDALPEEKDLVAGLVEDAGGAVILLSAPPDFQRYKALLEALDVLVTPNTGPMHIAAAVGTPVVALFSRWSAVDCGPYTDPSRCRILRAEDTDRPADGLAAIRPERVAAAVLDILDAGPAAR